jgi:hypothetical protein
MSDTMASRSRRALLSGAVGGLAALAAAALGRPWPARAAAGDELIIGVANDAGSSQTILNSNATGASFTLKTTQTFGGSTGIFGWASSTANAVRGVYGKADSPTGFGVQGRNGAASFGDGAAIQAIGDQNHGLHATTAISDADAVRAENLSGAGNAIRATLSGTTGNAVYANAVNAEAGSTAVGVFAISEAPTGRGVVGYAAGNDDANVGVDGITNSTTGICVRGSTGSGTGVKGTSDTGTGVIAETTSGIALRAYASGGTGLTYAVSAQAVSAAGYAGHFSGRVFTDAFYELQEIADPAAPGANQARLFVRDSGGKTQLCVRFPTGAVQVIATEP